MSESLSVHGLSPTALLSRLIGIPSPNPDGDTTQIARFIGRYLEDAGATVEYHAPPGKPEAVSVVARIGHAERGPTVLYHAHIDTVPIGDDEARQWRTPPYTATTEGGRLYGKGSVDDKAPLAAMLSAFSAQAQFGECQGLLVLVAAAEEETGGQLGTRWLGESGLLPEADFIVVGEQTENQLGVANKGVMRATIEVRGVSVHATNPDRGVNAIYTMARIVAALEQYHQALCGRPDPLLGHPTCNVGTIHGGATANAVPDSCTVQIDRRMVPGELPQTVEDEIRAVVSAVSGTHAVTVDRFVYSSPYATGLHSDLSRQFARTVQEVTGQAPRQVGYLPGSDAKHLVRVCRGEMVIFGPGSYEVAHAPNEYVDLGEFGTCTEVLTRFARQALAGPALRESHV
ncbi:M20 family metallopeptidase [Deinococcus sp. UYEF24]